MKSLYYRKAHRWLGMVAALQLLVWVGSGLFFSILPIEEVRGGKLLEPAAAFRLQHVKLLSPNALLRQHKALADVSIDEIQIKQRLNTPIYLIPDQHQALAFDAETGKQLEPLNEDEARLIADNRLNRPILSATWVTSVPPGSEYRNGELPAWKIETGGAEGANLWIAATSGQVTAVRTDYWRLYDFLWGLHIMDYSGRENFHSWLLRGFALLGLVTIVSGAILFFMTRARRQRQ